MVERLPGLRLFEKKQQIGWMDEHLMESWKCQTLIDTESDGSMESCVNQFY